EVVNAKEGVGGTGGAVVEVICREEKYERGIEIGVGGCGEDVVREDEECGGKGIEYLKENWFGGGRFLPVCVIR
ncbi:hypothetical protein, partial [Bacillus subtilis]|uniref:hypothetical protein n=1 Tax=Bacillus subtilis TaxID=1423 RepID=UPI001BDBA8EF